MKAPSEKHLEDWIVNNFNRFGWPYEAHEGYDGFEGAHWLDEDTFLSPFYNKIVARQFPLPHGIADLILNNWGGLCVAELKKGVIDAETIAQCTRYMFDMHWAIFKTTMRIPPPKGINEYFWELAGDQHKWADSYVTGCVIGHSIKDVRLCAAMTNAEITCILYDYDEDEDVYTFEQLYPDIQAHNRYDSFSFSPTNQRILNAAVSDILEDRARHAMHSRKVHGDE